MGQLTSLLYMQWSFNGIFEILACISAILITFAFEDFIF